MVEFNDFAFAFSNVQELLTFITAANGRESVGNMRQQQTNLRLRLNEEILD